ncbi:acetylcholine receptor subunit alpha-like [Argopecten irradians]|uniref:acetylcholine receptor subunit alpha-like n=1 Tax=Argopecten irradians TaxID=31199 RepID=UPI003722B104
MDDVKTLMADLMVNYSNEIRPVKDQTRPVTVNVSMALVSINDFNEVTGIISVVAILFLSWTDESLVWESGSYNNTTSVTFSQKKIWLPKMYLVNPATQFEPISNKHFKVEVKNNGSITWSPGRIIEATCTPDVSDYPFDQQTCTIDVTAYDYSSWHVSLNVSQPQIGLDFFTTNSAWDVTSTSVSVRTYVSDIVSFRITMTRRPLNFMVSVVIPIILLAIVNPFVFILPYNSGERVSYSITVLLAFTVYMTVVSDRMPASSDPVSQLSYYILSMLSLSVFIVVINIIQIRTYNKHDNDEPMNPWIRSLALFFHKFCRKGKVESNLKDEKVIKQTSEATDGMNTYNVMRIDSVDETDTIRTHPNEKNGVQKTGPVPPEHITWQTIARLADKFYFILFLVFTGISSLIYYLSVTI